MEPRALLPPSAVVRSAQPKHRSSRGEHDPLRRWLVAAQEPKRWTVRLVLLQLYQKLEQKSKFLVIQEQQWPSRRSG